MSCICVGWGGGEVGQWLQMTGAVANTYKNDYCNKQKALLKNLQHPGWD